MKPSHFGLDDSANEERPLTHEQGCANCIQKIISADHRAPTDKSSSLHPKNGGLFFRKPLAAYGQNA